MLVENITAVKEKKRSSGIEFFIESVSIKNLSQKKNVMMKKSK